MKRGQSLEEDQNPDLHLNAKLQPEALYTVTGCCAVMPNNAVLHLCGVMLPLSTTLHLVHLKQQYPMLFYNLPFFQCYYEGK